VSGEGRPSGACVQERFESPMTSDNCQPRKRQRREPVPRSELPPDVWKVEHVAAFLACSRDYVYDQVAQGKLPHAKRGSLLFFDPAKVCGWAKGEG
jgi:excisionase family DNA binding protein